MLLSCLALLLPSSGRHPQNRLRNVRISPLMGPAPWVKLWWWKQLNRTFSDHILSLILMFLQFGGYTLIGYSKALFESFGFHDTQLVFIGLIIFQYAVVPLERLLSFAMKLMSRAFEFQADAYAKKLGYAKELRAGLIRLQEENLGTMNPAPWYSACHYTHPPLVERLAALNKPDNKKAS